MKVAAPGFDATVRGYAATMLRAMSGGMAVLALMGLTRTALNAA